MRILDRYMIKSIVTIFLGTILVFCFLYVLVDSASNLDEFIDRKIPLTILIQYYLSYLPVIMVQTSSIACLIAVL
ncbi:MAG: LptF/LptG family permease, partial [Candidatus Omnitrophica bacterium]|nr:LptF/LptG family permease [Candidatus Omnitrophota bacterium]